jgi:hypothetical protein
LGGGADREEKPDRGRQHPRTCAPVRKLSYGCSRDRFLMHSTAHSKARPLLRISLATTFVASLAVVATNCATTPTIPDRLDDSTFWAMVNELSEPGGYFHSDNFVSNELGFQYVIPEMLSAVGTGGVYVGVGPDQNFTYVTALRPRISFIVDIRRQNLLQHLMYKALIEMSSDRDDFLERLFSRHWSEEPPAGLAADSLFRILADLPRDSLLYEANLAAILDQLTRHHRFTLDAFDSASIQYVYKSFFDAGTALTYSSNAARGFGGRGMPSYRMLMEATDQDLVNRSYLGSDEAFAILKDLQERNLIVPVVGDFAGPKAIRAVGDWIRRHEASVDVFYVSNVEQYLFQQGEAWERFYGNVSTMPRDRRALFVRSVSNRGWRPRQHPYARSSSVTSSIDEVLGLFRMGRLQSYADIVDLSR